MREHRNCALVLWFARIMMKPLVQRRRGGKKIEQQYNPYKNRGNRCLAMALDLSLYEPHNMSKLADTMPGARGGFEATNRFTGPFVFGNHLVGQAQSKGRKKSAAERLQYLSGDAFTKSYLCWPR